MSIKHELSRLETSERNRLMARSDLYGYLAELAEKNEDCESAAEFREKVAGYEQELDELIYRSPTLLDVARHIGRKTVHLISRDGSKPA